MILDGHNQTPFGRCSMRMSIHSFLIGAIILGSLGCQRNKSIEPDFKDGGLAVKRLQQQWRCERIDFENWEDDDAVDSSLTICLINSHSVPNPTSDKSVEILRTIAREIMQSLQHPEKYKSFYVIFVKEEGSGLSAIRSHTLGGDIRKSDL
jgi:hypothetical protein